MPHLDVTMFVYKPSVPVMEDLPEQENGLSRSEIYTSRMGVQTKRSGVTGQGQKPFLLCYYSKSSILILPYNNPVSPNVPVRLILRPFLRRHFLSYDLPYHQSPYLPLRPKLLQDHHHLPLRQFFLLKRPPPPAPRRQHRASQHRPPHRTSPRAPLRGLISNYQGETHSLRPCTEVCDTCSALHWRDKAVSGRYWFSSCCSMGDGLLDPPPDPPPLLKELLQGDTPRAKHFLDHIRGYNSALTFTSCCYGEDKRLRGRGGIQSFTIHGELYHLQGPLHAPVVSYPPLRRPTSMIQLMHLILGTHGTPIFNNRSFRISRT